MTSVRDPSDMTAAERLRELSDLFALGYLRLVVARRESRNPIAAAPESEPLCDPVTGSEDKLKEVR